MRGLPLMIYFSHPSFRSPVGLSSTAPLDLKDPGVPADTALSESRLTPGTESPGQFPVTPLHGSLELDEGCLAA